MRSLLLISAAALVAASPAQQAIDFDAIKAAPAPSQSGPVIGAVDETDVYDASAASASAVAAVSAVATASATASDVSARSLEERTFCWIPGWCKTNNKGSSSGSHSSKPTTTCTTSITSTKGYATATPTPTTTSCTTGTGTTTTPAVTSPATTSGVVPSTCTPVSWTNTFAFTTDPACATPYEVGTYCGFINPEDPCAPQPDGYGPVPTPDTVAGFYADKELAHEALSAASPSGYTATFKNLNGSVNANTYLGFHTLQSYDTASCASYCDDTDLCTSFNIYIERDPAWNPEQCSCSNPPSITNYKCSLWGSGVEAAAATNMGQSRGSFEVVVTGSNGYTKAGTTTPATPPNWTKPQSCSGSLHHHPSTCIGETIFKGPFDVSLCAAYADKQNQVNAATGYFGKFWNYFGYNRGKCNFFNAAMVKQDGKPVGTYCKLFSQQYEPAKATYKGGVSAGASWSFETSFSFCGSK
ncbi:hypothetical protein F5Y15DRAFT_392442 [Xylariaceae sp. FL0016]|nr:hypothetical protein F5Y15DRAFT_392442 [Xylariaceae sp. FL0016]